MSIAKKLLFIVLLTILEVSITVGAAFEIAKGAKFHQLNFLHLKYNAEFSNSLLAIDAGKQISTDDLSTTISSIRQQPEDCLSLVNFVDVLIMKQIKTYYALDLCRSDLKVADNASHTINQFRDGEIDETGFLSGMRAAEKAFHEHSEEFEAPVAKTVDFILRTLIPVIIFISVFNIAFITYLSRTISSAIKNAISLLSGSTRELGDDVEGQISGELAELLAVARKRIRSDILHQEVSAQLEGEVKKRTVALEQANAELAEFAYRASHDLKAPLTSSKGLANFISQDIDAGDLNEAKLNANKISRQMARLEKLVVGILSLTRADFDADPKEAIDFRELIQDAKERAYGTKDSADIIVIEEIEIQTPLFAEKVRIAQIIDNLLSNAIKYRDPEKEQTFVKIRVTEESSAYLLTVEDNGIGIPDSRRGEVFTMFKRFHPEIGEGTGLGLSIVKKHVDFLNGSIRFDSSSNGTMFSVQIPK